ncbi:MAG TPA: hypothetical protein VG267_22285 [Terracidiphilus sp.]|jgi:hypothetical protein|nr:hypothetical protein [Terracidiphilus sp.]
MATAPPSPDPGPLSGFVLVLIQFDVCEEIRLDRLQPSTTARTLRQPSTKQAAPAYVRYQRPPVIERLDPLVLDSGERLEGELKYFDYGVVSVIYQLPFSGNWDSLVHLASRWVWDVDFASRVEPIVRNTVARCAAALVKPYDRWISEDYFIFHVREAAGAGAPCPSHLGTWESTKPPSAAQLIREHGAEIAQVVRGDRVQLSEGERAEVLNSQVSYYAHDLAVIGWNAAFVYDTAAGAETAIQLLEYANSQLLEFRHYDELLTGVLDNVYSLLGRKTSPFARWRLARRATGLHRVLLDIGELTEHADNAIKFLSDMFAARLYRLAAAKVGVPDYKNLVAGKLKTAEDLHQDMLEQFNESRGFFLEVIVVIILVVELYFAFRGKPL